MSIVITGLENRVTCRDWFQLSLKEGLTVFREQEFSSDLGSRGVKRTEGVQILRSSQFLLDASPMAHPVRLDSYIKNQQLLHRHCLQQRRRSDSDDPDSAWPGQLPARYGSLLSAPRWLSSHLR